MIPVSLSFLQRLTFRVWSELALKSCSPGIRKNKDRRARSLIHTALALASFALLSFPAQSENYRLQKSVRFENITVEQGLPATRFLSTTQDKYGFMWFATDIGLVRYDGYEFIIYQNDPDDPASLPSNRATVVYMDSQNTLWVGTDAGLSRYNHDKDSFTNFRHNPKDPLDPGAPIVRIHEDHEGILWLGHFIAGSWFAGLSAFDQRKGSFTSYRHDPNDDQSLPPGTVMNIQEDRSGLLWIGTYVPAGGGGLARLDRTTNSFYRFPDCGPEQSTCPQRAPGTVLPPDFRTGGIYEDGSGNMWFNGSGSGLIKYDRQSNVYHRFICDPENPDGGVAQAIAGNIIEDDGGRLWFDDRFLGLTSFNPVSGACNHYRHDPADPSSIGIAQNEFLDLFQDNNGTVWVAGTTDNLSKFDPNSSLMAGYKIEPGLPANSSGHHVFSLAEDEDGVLWVGSQGGGLSRIDRATGKVKRYRHDPDDPGSLHSERVTKLYFDRAGTLWLGTRNGLSRFEITTETFQFYPIDPGVADPDTYRANDVEIESIAEDAEGNLWLAASAAVIRLNPDTGEVIRYRANPDEPGTLRGDWFISLWIDKDDTVWIGSTTGLNHLEPRSQSITYYVHDPEDLNSISYGLVHEIVRDQDDIIWVATATGLDRFEPVGGIFTHINDSKGDPFGEIFQVIPDGRGYLWIDTLNRGFLRVNPATGETRSFNENSGLSENAAEFSRPGLLSSRGEVIIATDGGLNFLDPDNLPGFEREPVVVFTDFLLNNTTVPVSGAKRETPLSASIHTSPEIELTYRDYLFSFEFAAPGYKYPRDLRYAYMLEGFDKDWIETGFDRRIATYTSVPPGDYLLRLKAAGINTGWNEDHTTIRIRILPPWWQTWWAYSLYAIVFMLALFGYIQLRTRNLRHRARLLKQTVEERTAQIREHEQQIQHQAEDLEELLHLKEKLITNISHEFRTPLTLILGPVQRLLQNAGNQRDASQLKLIKRNSQRLLRLVNQLLGLAHLGADQPLVRSAQPVSTTVDAITESFQPLAEDKGLQLNVERNDELWANCAPDALEKILLNLLSNAIKYTPAGGSITISTRPGENNMVEVSVSDTGIGIPEAEQSAVFERFHRLGNGGETIPGAGIGLALVKELVLAHDGEVSLVSQPGRGTTFTVRLPRCEAGLPRVDKAGKASNGEAMTLELEAMETLAGRPETEPVTEENSKPLLLIVEDNTDLQHYLVELLSDSYQCLVAGDGEEALEVAFEHIPDLVLLDLMLPKLDGFQVSHALKEDERTSHIPIIMLTARDDRDSRMESWKEKVDGYLTKPFDDDELRMRIANLLEIRDILKCRFSSQFFAETNHDHVAGQKENGFLIKLEQVLENCHSEPGFGASQMASEMYMSARQLQRKLKAVTGHHPAEFLRSYRLRKARGLLQEGMQVGLTADTVGFSSPTYFTSCFKAQFGVTPSEFQSSRASVRSI